MTARFIKLLGILTFITIILIFISINFTRTEYFRHLLKKSIEKAVNSSTKQSLIIGKIEGNPLTVTKLKDVSLKIEGEPFIQLKEVTLNYSFLNIINNLLIFRKLIPLFDISLNGLEVNLIRYSDGKWNFNNLESERSKGKAKPKKSKKSFNWNIGLNEILVKDAKIKVDDRKENEVSLVEIPLIESSARYISEINSLDLDLTEADIMASPQDITIKGLSAKAHFSNEKVKIEKLKADLNGAEINFDGEINNLKQREFVVKASATGYKIKEIAVLNVEIEGFGQYINPETSMADIKIRFPNSKILGRKVSGGINSVRLDGSKLNVKKGTVSTDFGEASINGNIDIQRIVTKKGKNEFNFDVSLKDVKTVEVFSLLRREQLKSKVINTSLTALLNTNIRATGFWNNLEDFKAKANIDNFQLKGENTGSIDVNGVIEATRRSIKVDLKSKINRFDLSSIFGNEKYKSNLTSDLQFEGNLPLTGDFLDKLNAKVNAKISPSSAFDVKIDKGNIVSTYSDNTLQIQSLSLISDSFNLKVEGTTMKGKGIHVSYNITINNPKVLQPFFPIPEVRGSLTATGSINGEIKKPRVTFLASAKDFRLKKDFESNSITLSGSGVVDLADPQLHLDGNIKDLTIKGISFEGADIQVRSEGKGLKGEASMVENQLRNYKFEFSMPDIQAKERSIILSKVDLNLGGKSLQSEDRIAVIISRDRLVVKSFNLFYENSSVLANADMNFVGNVDLDLKLNNLSLSDVSQSLTPDSEVQGVTSANINIKGAFNDPIITANINGSNLKYDRFESDSARLNLSYSKKKLDLNLSVEDKGKELFLTRGSIYVDLNFNKIAENISKASLDLTIKSAEVDLSPMAILVEEIKNIEGNLITNLKVTGTLEKPVINGDVEIKQGKLRLYSLRNDFIILEALLEFQGNRGILRSLEIQSDGGKGHLSGEIDLETISYNVAGKLDNLNIKPKWVSANLKGDLSLSGNKGKLSISGDLMIPKARVTIPDEEEKKLPEIKFVDEEKEEFVLKETKKTDLFNDDVAVDLKASLARNTWIKGRGANIEVKGNFDIKKDFGGPLRIFGTANTLRGNYRALGKVFSIERGSVNFRGTHDINPLIDIQALYKVSSIKIFINISGTAKKPEIKFSSDPPLQEIDILSYLVFGTSSDKIGSNERRSLQGAAAGLAGGIALNQLKSLIGEGLSPDVLRITGSEYGTELEVGKYLTENLYISYKRGVADSPSGTSTLTTDWIFIEYQIFNFLTLDSQMGGQNSGADMFYNFNY